MKQAFDTAMFDEREIAVLIPCFNEALTVAKVVDDFRDALPGARIYVYDNNSTDDTVAVARAAGAIVKREGKQGKGNVVSRMFADIDADIYVMVDGDATYEAAAAPRLIARLIEDDLDFVNGLRVSEEVEAYRAGHRLGNMVLSALVRNIFGREFNDMLSGFKVFSNRFVKSFASRSTGFEIETELTVHGLELRMPCAEEPVRYGGRPEGSVSKLHTFRDGFRIVRLIANLFRNERPLQLFVTLGVAFIAVAVLIDIPLARTYFETGLVPRLPTAVLSVGLTLVGVLGILAGLILDMAATMRYEIRRLRYLSLTRPDKGREFSSYSAGPSPLAALAALARRAS